jgi:hypothetical protein
MLDTMTRNLAGIADIKVRQAIRRIVRPLIDRYSSQALTSAGLVINAGGAAFPKIGGADFYACVQGVLVKIAAGTAMPALTGITAPAGGFNVAMFFVDSAGTVTVAGGTPAATLGGVGWPQPPDGKALVGFLIITNAGAFTGGTTALDGGTTIYISPNAGPFDPTALV